MENYTALIFILFFYFGMSAQTPKSKDSKASILEKTHWMIERSEINKVKSEFQKICEENHLKSMVNKLKDGTYRGETPTDDYGYRHVVIFEIKNGKMISIDYDEINQDGHAKQHDEDYCKRMLESGTSPAIAYPKYEAKMLEKQDFKQVDAVCGATYSLYRFRLAILYAISNSEQL
jgi:major membrane immunogen (membrane-anchored lipoprotein)